MGLKEKIEGNIIVVLFGSVVAASTVVAGVMSWFDDQKADIEKTKYESKLDELTSRITSVERRIGGEKYLDVRSLFDNKAPTSPTGAALPIKYFPEGHFSALSSVSGLKYEQSNEGKLLAEFMGLSSDDAVLQGFNAVKADVWRGEPMKIDSDLYKTIFPVIMVEHITHDDLGRMVRGFIKADKSRDGIEKAKSEKGDVETDGKPSTEILNSNDLKKDAKLSEEDIFDEEDKKVIKFFERTFDADASAAMISSFFQFATMVNNQDSYKESISIRNIQKVGPVAYLQMIITLNDVAVNGVKYDRYFIVRELFIISSHTDLSVIATTIPTDNPFAPGQTLAAVNEWLACFHLEE